MRVIDCLTLDNAQSLMVSGCASPTACTQCMAMSLPGVTFEMPQDTLFLCLCSTPKVVEAPQKAHLLQRRCLQNMPLSTSWGPRWATFCSSVAQTHRPARCVRAAEVCQSLAGWHIGPEPPEQRFQAPTSSKPCLQGPWELAFMHQIQER